MIKETWEAAKKFKNLFEKMEKLNEDIQHLQAIGESTVKAIELTNVAIHLQQMIGSLQNDLRALELHNRELEDEVSKLRHFEIEKDQYVPFQFATGAFAYRSNHPLTNTSGDATYYYLCANCYHQGKKSILQPAEVVDSHRTLRCHSCSSLILSEYIESTILVARSRDRIDLSGY
ncbi:hypothetical protein A1D29_10525 [Pasteurellaceae bacterium Orientalotternb1]|nr:hypothetical protein A1D29_10525 [Pasteurellaceae bacterium Orientalotternb1]